MTLLTACVLAASMKWTQLPSIPDKEGFAAPFAGVSHGTLLVAGGANFPDKKPWEGGIKVWHKSVFALQSPEGEWLRVGDLPRPLGYGVSVTYREKVICVGGSDSTSHQSGCFSLELTEGKLIVKPLPPLPFPMANGCGALVGSVIYVAGGQEKPESTTSLKRVLALDLSAPTAQWKEIQPLPGPGRILATAAAKDGAFWVMGGAELNHGPNGSAVRKYLSDAFKFIPGRGWERVVDMPHPVVAAPSPAPVLGNEIWLLGGDDGSRVGTPPTSHPGFPRTTLRFNTESGSWSKGDPMPVGRVTVPTAVWKDGWVIPNGEDRPGIRSPEVWQMKKQPSWQANP